MAAENKNNSKDLTNAKTEGILNEDTSSVRKKGRPRNSELSDVQLALQAKRRLDKKNQKVKKLTRSLARAKKEIKSEEKALTSNVLTKEETKVLPQQIQEHLDETGSHVAFMPNEGPQTDFLAAPEKDVLYGGAAGGGKSFAMLIDPLRYCHKSAHRALILRRSMPELRELIDKSRELYPRAFPGAKFREVEKLWNFPSGAKIEFGFLERDADVYRYQGQAYSWIGFDEITHLPTEFGWNYLASRLRTTDPELQTYLRCTANPGGVGAQWVKKRYVEPSNHNKSFVGKDGLTRKFIPARLQDNPFLAEDGEYERMLLSLPPVQRKQLLEGNWEISEGAAFAEFDLDIHVIPPFEIPAWWERLKGVDYGYASESCCLWAAIDPEDKTIIIYRELYEKGLTGEALGNRITELEESEVKSITGVLDTSAWSKTGYSGPTIGETLVRQGHKLRRADKNRVAGKIQVHEYLRQNRQTGRPKLQIVSSCKNLIKELQSLPLSSSNSEDVDTHSADHAYDALRYMLMSRPRMDHPYDRMLRIKTDLYEPSDGTFGY
ncbi:MAG: Terminase-like family protein [Candidatus Pelagibacter sp.]|nr:Terminase-like family protein [Candidatus Pelagibacter sp.]|tara:strand:- start:9687 stop:11333 length:1647 start_codon:yes stop_codon:yes gene_type:complete